MPDEGEFGALKGRIVELENAHRERTGRWTADGIAPEEANALLPTTACSVDRAPACFCVPGTFDRALAGTCSACAQHDAAAALCSLTVAGAGNAERTGAGRFGGLGG